MSAADIAAELPLEQAVSRNIAAMHVLWLEVDDAPGGNSKRGIIERGAISLLSNHERAWIDPPSTNWLGHNSTRPLVRDSGLWNQNHVCEPDNPAFLDLFEELVERV
ncbi:hypothetical protein [Halovulum dunhuangense]|uniref:hypothetical protein n=1 Tax=Halovulum dunhuangense TaxID=1505036 RepID=UPI001C0EFFBF|nr:hypothetical protein [Halovulum dunhuangense]